MGWGRPNGGHLTSGRTTTEAEVERLIKATQDNHYGLRDGTMILLAYRHGLRAAELVAYGGSRSTSEPPPCMSVGSSWACPARIRSLATNCAPYVGSGAEQEPKSPFVFTSERGAPFTTAGFARMIERAGKVAKLSFKAHPHMLRRARGYALANRGHDTRALQASAIAISSTPCATPNSRRRGSRILVGRGKHNDTHPPRPGSGRDIRTFE